MNWLDHSDALYQPIELGSIFCDRRPHPWPHVVGASIITYTGPRLNRPGLHILYTPGLDIVIGHSFIMDFRIVVLISVNIKLSFSFTLYPIYSRIGIRKPSVKTLCFPISVEFWRHCASSGGTQSRILPRHQSEGMKILNI